MSLALFSDIVPATFRTVFVPGPALRPGPGHISGCFCSRPSLPAPSRPRLGLYLFPAVPPTPPQPRLRLFLFPDLLSGPAPATFGAVFVAGSWGVAVRDMFVASNCLCVRELLNILAANGEQGYSGSGWCTVSWVPPTCLVCLIPRCLGHV